MPRERPRLGTREGWRHCSWHALEICDFQHSGNLGGTRTRVQQMICSECARCITAPLSLNPSRIAHWHWPVWISLDNEWLVCPNVWHDSIGHFAYCHFDSFYWHIEWIVLGTNCTTIYGAKCVLAALLQHALHPPLTAGLHYLRAERVCSLCHNRIFSHRHRFQHEMTTHFDVDYDFWKFGFCQSKHEKNWAVHSDIASLIDGFGSINLFDFLNKHRFLL